MADLQADDWEAYLTQISFGQAMTAMRGGGFARRLSWVDGGPLTIKRVVSETPVFYRLGARGQVKTGGDYTLTPADVMAEDWVACDREGN